MRYNDFKLTVPERVKARYPDSIQEQIDEIIQESGGAIAPTLAAGKIGAKAAGAGLRAR